METRTTALAGWEDGSVQRLAQPVAATVGALVCAWGLLDGVLPTRPLWTVAAVLVAGLIAGVLARLTAAPSAPAYVEGAAALVALVAIAHALPDRHPGWPMSPLWIVALVLGLGLVVVAMSAQGVDWPGSALAVASLAGTLIFLWPLAADFHTFIYHGAVDLDNGTAVAGIRPYIDLLSFALVVSVLPGHRTLRQAIAGVAVAVAMATIISTLVSAPSSGLYPLWAYDWTTVVLGCALAAVILPRLRAWPDAAALRRRIEELSRTRSGALDVQAAELRRIERDLHDGAQVQLIALSIKLGRAEDRYRDDPETAALLREAREDATTAIRELRELARGIAPAVLVNRGLEAAVRSIAQRSGSEVAITSRLERRPGPAVERAAYFVVAEALANAAKHAAGSRVEIDLRLTGGEMAVTVTDFGPGGADPRGGGLTGLRQRVEALDGVLNVTSPQGVGTHLEAVMPCER